MNLLIEVVGKDALKILIVVGFGAIMTKMAQAKKLKMETPAVTIDAEF